VATHICVCVWNLSHYVVAFFSDDEELFPEGKGSYNNSDNFPWQEGKEDAKQYKTSGSFNQDSGQSCYIQQVSFSTDVCNPFIQR